MSARSEYAEYAEFRDSARRARDSGQGAHRVIYAYSADGGKAEHEKIRQTHAPSPSPRDARRSLPLRSESADGTNLAPISARCGVGVCGSG